MNTIRWSFSQWENYDGCPARWKYKSVLKLPSSPPGPAAARGIDMHSRVEQFIKGEIDEEFLMEGDVNARFGTKRAAKVEAKFVPMLTEFRDHPNGDRWTELKLGFDSEWYLSGGASPTASCIMVLDAARCIDKVAHVGEWKSGTPKPTHGDQRKMYGLGALRRWTGVEEVIVTTYYLEGTAPPAQLIIKPTALEKLVLLWDHRVDQMQRDEICAPKPGEHCRWCDYSAAKGGPCKFGA